MGEVSLSASTFGQHTHMWGKQVFKCKVSSRKKSMQIMSFYQSFFEMTIEWVSSASFHPCLTSIPHPIPQCCGAAWSQILLWDVDILIDTSILYNMQLHPPKLLKNKRDLSWTQSQIIPPGTELQLHPFLLQSPCFSLVSNIFGKLPMISAWTSELSYVPIHMFSIWNNPLMSHMILYHLWHLRWEAAI